MSLPKSVNTPDKSRSSREDVLQFLDSLDSYSASPRSLAPSAETSAAAASTATPLVPTVTNAEDAQSVLDFLDEITQRSSTPTAPVKSDPNALSKKAAPGGLSRSSSRTNVAQQPPHKSGESARSRVPDSPSPAPAAASSSNVEPPSEAGWGWSSVWSQASSVVQQASHVVQQARTVAEEQVKTASSGGGIAGGISGGIGGIGEGLLKALNENEQAKKWSEGVVNYAKGAHLDKLGKDLKSTTLRSLTDLLNAVAPPIAEHEVLQVSLSHDMIGYDGVETLVYNALAKVMEQIEGGTLVVNKGNAEKARESKSEDPDERDLKTVEGLAEGWKLAQANIDELIRVSFKPQTEEAKEQARTASLTVPVTTCPIYIRIQPCIAPMPFSLPPASPEMPPPTSLFFLFLLRDPTHGISHSTLSQAMPSAWLEVPFEENEWVEDIMVNVIRQGVEIVGKEYIETRMHAQAIAIAAAREEALQALAQSSSAPPSASAEPVAKEGKDD